MACFSLEFLWAKFSGFEKLTKIWKSRFFCIVHGLHVQAVQKESVLKEHETVLVFTLNRNSTYKSCEKPI